MTQVKLTKNELRDQQGKLGQLQKYLPTLQLKKSLLQIEVNNALIELEDLNDDLEKSKQKVKEFAPLFAEKVDCDPIQLLEVFHVYKTYENIAGVEIPLFEKVSFHKDDYFFFDTPIWLDAAVRLARQMVKVKENIYVVLEKKRALEKELREVSIRVNLFEKILIPRCIENIKKIKVFLGDQLLAAVAQAKVAKQKIIKKRESQ